jgi:DNA replication licensing factor MCM5
VLPDKCQYVDQQTWKLQEAPESVPTGEMPRSIMMTVDRKLVDCASPGKRVLVTAIMSVMTQAKPPAGGKRRPSALLDGTAPSARPVPPTAQAAPHRPQSAT